MKALFIEPYIFLSKSPYWNDDISNCTFNREALLAIKEIADKTGAYLYLIGGWRDFWNAPPAISTPKGVLLEEAFASVGLTLTGKVKTHAKNDVVKEIEYFFFEHPECTSFAIIDSMNKSCAELRSRRVLVDNGIDAEKIDRVISLLNTPASVDTSSITPSSYKLVLDDNYLLPMTEQEWEIEARYEGKFGYRRVLSDFGTHNIIRIDNIELDEKYKDIVLNAELYAAEKFTGDKNNYYTAYMEGERRLMSYAFICDKYILYYSYKKKGFAMQGYSWLSHLTLNPSC